MPLDLQSWMERYVSAVRDTFGERIVTIGLQGSYGRGEATESSDIDVVLILDELSMRDVNAYAAAIAPLPCREKICGFVSGKDEILHWEKSDLFQFYYDTEPVLGDMDFLKPLIRKTDVRRAVLTGACNIYHACCHNLLHERSGAVLLQLMKTAAFVLRAEHFYETGVYIRKMEGLLRQLPAEERALLGKRTGDGREEDDAFFAGRSEKLLAWAGCLIGRYAMDGREE